MPKKYNKNGSPKESRLYQEIQDNPGQTVSGLVKSTGFEHQAVAQLLLKLETQGKLLCEDDDGRLYVFDQTAAASHDLWLEIG